MVDWTEGRRQWWVGGITQATAQRASWCTSSVTTLAVGHTPNVDLERAGFDLVLDGPGDDARATIVPFASVKRVLVHSDDVSEGVLDTGLRKVALHFWDGEVVKGLVRGEPERHRNGMTLELISPGTTRAEVYALPYHALKAVVVVRDWDTRSAESRGARGAPLVELLSEMRAARPAPRSDQRVEY